MTIKVKLLKILSFKSGIKEEGKEWQTLEILVAYETYGKNVEVILNFSGKSDIGRIEKYPIGTLFNTEMIPKTTIYESGKHFTKVYGLGSLTDKNIEVYNEIRSQEIDNPFATQL